MAIAVAIYLVFPLVIFADYQFRGDDSIVTFGSYDYLEHYWLLLWTFVPVLLIMLGITYAIHHITRYLRSCMNRDSASLKRRLLGAVYISIGIVLLVYAIHYTLKGYGYFDTVPADYLVFVVPAYAITGITFWFGVRRIVCARCR